MGAFYHGAASRSAPSMLPSGLARLRLSGITATKVYVLIRAQAPIMASSGMRSRQVISMCRIAFLASLFLASLWAFHSAAAQDATQRLAMQCAMQNGTNLVGFAQCTGGQPILSPAGDEMVQCAAYSNDVRSFAGCAGQRVIGDKLPPQQQAVIGCAQQSGGDTSTFASCVGGGLLADQLTPQQQALVNCAASNSGIAQMATCAGETLYGDKLTPEERAAAECAVQSGGDATQFAGCAANKVLASNLNPEQQIAVTCVVSTGGQPYAAAGCIATALTGRELEKCITQGVGGNGCFGDNNDLVGRHGWLVRNISSIPGGPNSMIRNPGQILGGPNSMFRNPGQITGGPNSMINNPGQIAGGPNSVIRNPGQLAPPPLQLGTVGGHRVCVPWC